MKENNRSAFFIHVKLFFYRAFLCAAICPQACNAAAGEKNNEPRPARIRILKGNVRGDENQRFAAGKEFRLPPGKSIIIEPLSVIEVSGVDSLPEKSVVRNYWSHKEKKFSVPDYLKRRRKYAGENAYQRLKSVLLPRKYYPVCRFEGKLKIDGKLDEKAWKTAVPMPLFTDLVTGRTPRFAATCKALWDDGYLYLGYRVEDPCIWALARSRDEQMYAGQGENNGNFIKFFADPDCDGRDYVEIHVNPRNNVMDAWLPFNWRKRYRKEVGIDDVQRGFLAIEWDCEGMETAVDIQGTLNRFDDVDEGWTAELKIPFKSLRRFDRGSVNVPPKNNTRWLVHLCRRYRLSRNAPEADTWYFAWPAAEALSTHRSSKFGYFIFRNLTWAELLRDIYKDMERCGND